MRHARAARRYIITTALTGGTTALLVVAQAVLISRSVSPVITTRVPLSAVAPLVGLLALVVVARVLVLYAQEALAHRAASRTIIELRRQVLEHAAMERDEDAATTLTRAAAAAQAGAEATRGMRARRGRAAHFGERSVGHLDPGAVSMAMILDSASRHLI